MTRTLKPSTPLLATFVTLLSFACTPEAASVVDASIAGAAEESTPGEQDDGPKTDEAASVPDGIVNFTRVDATVACAGATPVEALPQLAEQGYRAIINFRTAEESGALIDESMAAAEAAGMRYIHLPFRSPTAEVTAAFLEAVAQPENQPAFIHCGSANRVGAMWLIKRVALDGWTVADATTEAEAIGLRSAELKEFALAYVDAEAEAETEAG